MADNNVTFAVRVKKIEEYEISVMATDQEEAIIKAKEQWEASRTGGPWNFSNSVNLYDQWEYVNCVINIEEKSYQHFDEKGCMTYSFHPDMLIELNGQ